MIDETRSRRRGDPSTRAYFVREGLELCLIVGGLVIAGWITRVPLWIWIAVPIGKALISILFYVLFLKRSLLQRPRHELRSLAGRTARTLAPLNPDGQIMIDGEIWLARSCTGGVIPSHQNVLIRDARGTLLLVEAQTDCQKDVPFD